MKAEAALKAFDEDVARMRAAFPNGDPRDREWIKRKLAHMAAVDRFMRNQFDKILALGWDKAETDLFWDRFHPRWDAIDSRNLKELKALLEDREWFKISEFGPIADQDGWLLVQHADNDVPFQKQILGVLERLLPAGETSGRNFAYLWDRVAVAEKRPQRFGTQGRCVEKGRWEPWPSENPEELQKRRDALDLGPLEENIKRVSALCRGENA